MEIARRSVLALPVVAAGAAGLGSLLQAPGAEAAPRAMQSPIDIDPATVPRNARLPRLRVSYTRSTPVTARYITKDASTADGCQVRGEEETEEIDVQPGAGHVMVGRHRWDLVQFHFHTPSEHTIDGRHVPLEMHLVHQDAADRRLVLSVLMRPGAGSEADRVLTRLPAECGQPIEVPDLDLASLVPRRPATLRYRGSLTTAPYDEGVRWLLTVPSTTSPEGIAAFQSVFPDGDSRPTQPLHGRRVVADPGWRARP